MSEIFGIQPNDLLGDAAKQPLISAAQGSKGLRVCLVAQDPIDASTQALIDRLRQLHASVTVFPSSDRVRAGFWDIMPAPGINDWMRYLFLDWTSPVDAKHENKSDDDIRRYYVLAARKANDVRHQFVMFGGEDFALTPDPTAREPKQIESKTFFERCLLTRER